MIVALEPRMRALARERRRNMAVKRSILITVSAVVALLVAALVGATPAVAVSMTPGTVRIVGHISAPPGQSLSEAGSMFFLTAYDDRTSPPTGLNGTAVSTSGPSAGDFEVWNLPAGATVHITMDIHVWCANGLDLPGWQVPPLTGIALPAQEGTTLTLPDIQLTQAPPGPSPTLVGKVTGPGGTPLNVSTVDMDITATDSGKYVGHAFVRDQQCGLNFALAGLPAGRAKLTIKIADRAEYGATYLPRTLTGVIVDLAPGQQTVLPTIELARAGVVTGHLTGPGGVPLVPMPSGGLYSGLSVTPYRGTTDLSEKYSSVGSTVFRSGPRLGDYEIRGLPAGQITRLIVSSSDHVYAKSIVPVNLTATPGATVVGPTVELDWWHAAVPQHVVGVASMMKAKSGRTVKLPARTDGGSKITWSSQSSRICRVHGRTLVSTGRVGMCRVKAIASAASGLSALQARFSVRAVRR